MKISSFPFPNSKKDIDFLLFIQKIRSLCNIFKLTLFWFFFPLFCFGLPIYSAATMAGGSSPALFGLCAEEPEDSSGKPISDL